MAITQAPNSTSSAASVNSRTTLQNYALRKLGYPVVEINVTDDQLEDRLDDALQFFSEYHFDGVEKVYLNHQVTATDISNGYISVPDSVASIIRVFTLGGYLGSDEFSGKYQALFSDVFSMFGSRSIIHYSMVRQNMSLMSGLLTGSISYEYSRKADRLYLFIDWDEELDVGEYLMFEAYRVLDPETYPDIYNDILLKEYFTELVKKQWADNLSKFQGVQMPGGIQFNADAMRQEANERIRQIEEEVQVKWQLPDEFMVG